MARCAECRRDRGRHAPNCSRDPSVAEPYDQWVEWHLTSSGWSSGNFKSDNRVHARNDTTPEGTVLTVRVGVLMRRREAISEVWRTELFRRPGAEAEITNLLTKHGDAPDRYSK